MDNDLEIVFSSIEKCKEHLSSDDYLKVSNSLVCIHNKLSRASQRPGPTPTIPTIPIPTIPTIPTTIRAPIRTPNYLMKPTTEEEARYNLERYMRSRGYKYY